MSIDHPIPESEYRTGFGQTPPELDRPYTELTKPERAARWRHYETAINRVVDAEGEPVDPGIKDALVALNALEINTTNSCEGHVDKGCGVPWIRIESPRDPDEHFQDEIATCQAMANKFGVSLDDVRRGACAEAKDAAAEIYLKNDETVAFHNWKQSNRELRQRVVTLLDSFYSNRETSTDSRITIDDYGDDSFKISVGAAEKPIDKTGNTQIKAAIEARLQLDRQELNALTEYIKNLLFSDII